MTEIKRSITIKASPEKVFSYISDYRNWSDFYEGFSDVKPITENTLATGSKFIYKTRITGMTFRLGTEFKDFVMNQGWNGESFKGVEHTTHWRVKKITGGTEFTHGITYKLPWYNGGRLFDSLIMKSAFTKIVERSLQNVKAKLETEG